MKVRMLVGLSGTRNGEKWPQRGEVTDLPTAEAEQLVSSGIAEQADEDAPVEAATAPPAEVSVPPAAKPPSRRRGRPAKGATPQE